MHNDQLTHMLGDGCEEMQNIGAGELPDRTLNAPLGIKRSTRPHGIRLPLRIRGTGSQHLRPQLPNALSTVTLMGE